MGSFGSPSRELVDAKTPDSPDSGLPFFSVFLPHLPWIVKLVRCRRTTAVKGNSDLNLLQTLANPDINFDCTSLSEIPRFLRLGIGPSRTLFAPHVQVRPLRSSWQSRPGLLRTGRELDLIETGATGQVTLARAVQQARHVYGLGQGMGLPMCSLDVGGVFQDSKLELMAGSLQKAISEYFWGSATPVIAEPGRFYATPYCTETCRVIARRKSTGPKSAREETEVQLANFLYQKTTEFTDVFSCRWGEHQTGQGGPHHYSTRGPIYDSVNLFAGNVVIDGEVRVGDCLKYTNIAYSISALSQSNGFPDSYAVIYR
ncbi:hypothetical protein BDW71DRAFT_193681 [Aspergillus fruticulosus]